MKDFFIIAMLILMLVFIIKMGIHVYQSNLSLLAKIVWIFVLIAAPLLGATLYYISDHGRDQ